MFFPMAALSQGRGRNKSPVIAKDSGSSSQDFEHEAWRPLLSSCYASWKMDQKPGRIRKCISAADIFIVMVLSSPSRSHISLERKSELLFRAPYTDCFYSPTSKAVLYFPVVAGIAHSYRPAAVNCLSFDPNWLISILTNRNLFLMIFTGSDEIRFNVSIFFWAGRRLMACSSLRASLFDNPRLAAMNRTGRRDRVYFAPFPALCFEIRASMSFVIPQYKELSAHFNKYTFQIISRALVQKGCQKKHRPGNHEKFVGERVRLFRKYI